jgi:hypothetical protein
MLQRLAVATTLLLLAASTVGQQTVAPGATALEAEQEEIRRYSVELIIFEYTDPSSAGTEVFDPDEPPPLPEEDFYFGDTPAGTGPFESEESGAQETRESGNVSPGDDSGDLAPAFIDEPLKLIPTYAQTGLVVLGPEDYVLDKEFDRLERLEAYRPLMRAAWIQPTLEKQDTLPINLRRLGNPPLQLDGTVTLYLSRYLHLVIDLSLEEKSPLRVPAADNRFRSFGDDRSRFGFDPDFIKPSTFYRIDEDRIVRNGELRYYDHPRFGVLAKITRVEEDDAGENNSGLFVTPITRSN